MARKNASHEDLDMDQMAEAELTRLQRQYRIMEGDREAYSQETRLLLQKQRNMIAALEKEKQELLQNLRLSKSTLNEMRDNKLKANIAQLIAEGDRYEAEMKTEKEQLSEMQLQINKIEKEVASLRVKEATDNKNSHQNILPQQMSALENRLDVVTVKFNKILAENSKLREEINHLLKERNHFNSLYQQLVSELNSGKKIMLDLIEQASLAYDQREEAQNKLQALKERGRLDVLLHGQEMRELHRRLDYDTKLQDFLAVKAQRRVMADLEAREAQKKQMQREATEKMIESYHSILQKIKEFSGEDDVDRLAAQFLKQEEENFALFNYVNELNNELEALQDQVDVLKTRIDEQRALNRQRAQQQQDCLADLRSQLEERTKEAQDTEDILKDRNDVLSKVLEGIERIFSLAHCAQSPVLQLLGEETRVTTHNVMLYLGIIERCCNDLANSLNNDQDANTVS
ncbi:coiled-coil domain-containing protein 63 [Schistocerca piceifrons]|uniref:coiled-coil domain-containing protein 63 n=1 Tax=Schistocerca piceifrons TaxID=274613 RepID=UPI001F5EBBE8|nr:coiled-coil domain-containing protein 63 [Schistocerca piceifrons]